MKHAVRTNIGHVREVNEDAFYAEEGLYAVADGMGGHAAGEVASRIAVDTVAETLRQEPSPTVRTIIVSVLRAAERIRHQAGENAAQRGMGTTLTVLWIAGDQATIAQVGDSRAYLLRGGALRQCTHDHSVVGELVRAGLITPQEAKHHPRRNLITRSLGAGERSDPDVFEYTREAGDRWLLCSDGLTNDLDDDEIFRFLSEGTIDEAADALLALALARGGRDNVTLCVVEDDGEGALA